MVITFQQTVEGSLSRRIEILTIFQIDGCNLLIISVLLTERPLYGYDVTIWFSIELLKVVFSTARVLYKPSYS